MQRAFLLWHRAGHFKESEKERKVRKYEVRLSSLKTMLSILGSSKEESPVPTLFIGRLSSAPSVGVMMCGILLLWNRHSLSPSEWWLSHGSQRGNVEVSMSPLNMTTCLALKHRKHEANLLTNDWVVSYWGLNAGHHCWQGMWAFRLA